MSDFEEKVIQELAACAFDVQIWAFRQRLKKDAQIEQIRKGLRQVMREQAARIVSE